MLCWKKKSTSRGSFLILHTTTHRLLSPMLKHITHCLIIFSVNVQQELMHVNECKFFSTEGILWYTSTLYTLSCQISFNKTAAWLISLISTIIIGYWQKGSTSIATIPKSQNMRYYFESNTYVCGCDTYQRAHFILVTLI